MKKIKMTARERILLNIAIETSGSWSNRMMEVGNGFSIRTSYWQPAPQFLPELICDIIDMPLVEGDIIKCETNRSHEFAISVLIGIKYEPNIGTYYLCRKIGGKEVCKIFNEQISVLRFMPKNLLYEDKEYDIYNKVLKAFAFSYNKNANIFKKFGGIKIEGDKLTVWSRAHAFIYEKNIEDKKLYAKPKKFTFKWNSKTTIKSIVEHMSKNGFEDKFEYDEQEPAMEMTDFSVISKEELIKKTNWKEQL